MVAQAREFEPAMSDGTQENRRKNNATGYRGIGYRSKMKKYTARIGFQYQSHYLGAYQSIDDAIDVRKQAETLIYEKGDLFYARWKKRAEADPAWGREHPVRLCVTKKEEQGYLVTFVPIL